MRTSLVTLICLLCIVHLQLDDVDGSTSNNGIRFGVHDPVQSFYGRSDFLVRLRDSFQQQQDDEDNNVNQDTIHPIKIVIIEGPDGVGKTETIRKYVSTLSFSNNYDNVIWIDGESEHSITNSFLSLASKIRLPKDSTTTTVKKGKEKSLKEIVQQIYRHLGNDQDQLASLLIFDNVVSYKILQNFLPSFLPPGMKSPSILILTSGTTNETNNWPGGLSGPGQLRVLQLPEFTEEESAGYLLKQLERDHDHHQDDKMGTENWREAKKLGRYLRNLPLALELAVEDMKMGNLESSIIIKNCLHLLQRYTETYLDLTKGRGISAILPHPLYFEWRISMEKIGKHHGGDVAQQIMEYVSFFHPESTPVKLIYDIFAYEGESRSEISSQNVTQSLQLLEKYGMLRLSQNFQEKLEQPLVVHRKIQNFTINDFQRRPSRISQCLNFLLGRLDKFLTLAESSEEEKNQKKMYLDGMDHLVQKIGLVAPEFELIEYKLKFVMRLFHQEEESLKKEEEKEENYFWIVEQKAWKMMRESFESLHQLKIQERSFFIKIFTILELYEGPPSVRKEIFYQQMQTMVTKIFDPGHPLNLKILEKIAQTISSLEGRQKDALQVYEFLLKLQKLYLGPSDGDVVRTLQKLAEVYLGLGQNEEARVRFSEASEIESKRFGKEAPQTLESLHNVALVMTNEKRFEEALHQYEKILEMEKASLDPSHPSIFLTFHSIAVVHQEAGDLEAALKFFKKAFEGNSKILGLENPQTILSLREMASVYSAQQKFTEATQIFQQVYDLRKKILNENDPFLLSSGQDLAEAIILMEDTGAYEKGMKLLNEIFEKRQQILGPHHLDTMETLEAIENFRMTHKDEGHDVEEGVQNFEKIYQIRKLKLGENHESTLKALNGLAYSLMSQNREDEAMKIFSKIYSTQKQNLGSHHEDTLKSFFSLIRLYSIQGRHEKALQFLNSLYKFQMDNLDGGKKNRQVISTLHNMAQVRRRQGQLSQALKSYDEALEICKEILGQEHPLCVSTMQNKASVYYDQQDAEGFIKIQKEIYEIQSLTLGPDHPKSWATLKAMIEVYLIEEKWDKAMELYEKIYEQQKSKLGPQHLDTVATLREIANLIMDPSNGLAKGRDDKEVFEMYEKIYQIRKQELGPHHPDSLQSLQDLANFYYRQKDFDKALEIMEKVVEVKTEILGEDHDDTISSILKMVGVMRMQKRIDEVMKIYEQLYQMLKNKFGTHHDKTMQVFDKILGHLDAMAVEHSTKSAYGKALEVLNKAVDLRSTVLGKDHPKTLANLDDIALALYDQGMFKSALKTLGQVLESKKKNLGKGHGSVKETLHFINAIKMEMGQDDDDDDDEENRQRDEL